MLHHKIHAIYFIGKFFIYSTYTDITVTAQSLILTPSETTNFLPARCVPRPDHLQRTAIFSMFV